MYEENENYEEEFLNEQQDRKFLRILSMLLVISIIVVFVFPYIIMNLSYIQLFFSEDLSSKEVSRIVEMFEENYLYKEVFETSKYREAKKDLLDKKRVSKIEFNAFIKNITGESNDGFTYFIPLDTHLIDPEVQVEFREETNHYYLRIRKFSTGVSKVICKHLKSIKKDKNLIIDLRENPGGSLRELMKSLEMFLPKNVEAIRLKSQGKKVIYKTSKEQMYSFDKIYIFLDEKSASASEVLALSLYLNKENVKLIGKKTAGKSVVQMHMKGTQEKYEFLIVTHRWSVKNRSVEYLQKQLLDSRMQLESLGDYYNAID